MLDLRWHHDVLQCVSNILLMFDQGHLFANQFTTYLQPADQNHVVIILMHLLVLRLNQINNLFCHFGQQVTTMLCIFKLINDNKSS